MFSTPPTGSTNSSSLSIAAGATVNATGKPAYDRRLIIAGMLNKTTIRARTSTMRSR